MGRRPGVLLARPGPGPGEVRDAPDAGMAEIQAGFEVRAEVAAGRDLEHGDLEGGHGWRPTPEDVWLLDIPPLVQTAAGTADPVDWGPAAGSGRAWRFRSVTCTLQGASLVSVYREAAFGQQLRFQFTQNGVWEPSFLILTGGKRLVVVAAGGGYTLAADGEQIAETALPSYLI